MFQVPAEQPLEEAFCLAAMQRATVLLLAAVVSASAFVETVPELDVDKFRESFGMALLPTALSWPSRASLTALWSGPPWCVAGSGPVVPGVLGHHARADHVNGAAARR